jgi:hypothetical protein
LKIKKTTQKQEELGFRETVLNLLKPYIDPIIEGLTVVVGIIIGIAVNYATNAMFLPWSWVVVGVLVAIELGIIIGKFKKTKWFDYNKVYKKTESTVQGKLKAVLNVHNIDNEFTRASLFYFTKDKKESEGFALVDRYSLNPMYMKIESKTREIYPMRGFLKDAWEGTEVCREIPGKTESEWKKNFKWIEFTPEEIKQQRMKPQNYFSIRLTSVAGKNIGVFVIEANPAGKKQEKIIDLLSIQKNLALCSKLFADCTSLFQEILKRGK